MEAATLRLSRYHVCSEVVRVDGRRLRVVMATRTGEVVEVDSDAWDDLTEGRISALPPDVLALLHEIELVQECEKLGARLLGSIGPNIVMLDIVCVTHYCAEHDV